VSENISKMFSHTGCEKCNFIGPTLDGSDVIFDCFGKIEEDQCFYLFWLLFSRGSFSPKRNRSILGLFLMVVKRLMTALCDRLKLAS